MIDRRMFLSAIALLGCGKPEPKPEHKAETKSVTPDPVEVHWSLARDGAHLAIDYTVRNNTREPVLLFDTVRVESRGAELDMPERVIVKAADEPGQVLFVAGYVDPEPTYAVERETFPGYRTVAAGVEVRGHKVVDWPLAPWHPYIDMLRPLPQPSTTAVLQLSWMDAGEVSPPRIRTSMQQARGAVLPLPAR